MGDASHVRKFTTCVPYEYTDCIIDRTSEKMASSRVMQRRIQTVLLAVIVVVSLMVWGIAFVRHHNRKTTLAKTELRAGNAMLADRLDAVVAKLKQESNKESLTKLSDVNLFYSPGPTPEGGRAGGTWGVGVDDDIPLKKEEGQSDLECIMSNRRFCKVLEELGGMKEEAASKVVSVELSKAIADYLKLYVVEMQRLSPFYTLEKTAAATDIVGPGFETGQVPEDKVVIAGARLKVLALVWTSGMVGLTGAKDQVERVAREALKQRNDMYGDKTLHPFFKAQFLKMASLYNRQIIVSGLLGVTSDREYAASLMANKGASWRNLRIASYRAAVTEFDMPVRSGFMKPDHSSGSIRVEVITPLTDADFDVFLKELHCTP